MSEYTIPGSLIPSAHNTPTDPRTVVDTLDDLGNISYPYQGLLVYVKSTGKLYTITEVGGSGASTYILGYSEFTGSGEITSIYSAADSKTYTPDSEGHIEIPATNITSEETQIKKLHTKLPGTYSTWSEALVEYLKLGVQADGSEILWCDNDGIWYTMEAQEGDDGEYTYISIGSSSIVDYGDCTKSGGTIGETGEVSPSSYSLVSPYIYIPKLTGIRFSGNPGLNVWFYDSSYKPISGVIGKESGFFDYISGIKDHKVLPGGAQYVRYSHPTSTTPIFSLVTRSRMLRDGYILQDSYKKALELEGAEVYHEVAEWTRPGLNPDAELLDQGSLKIVNSKGVYLVDASSGTSVKVIGELQGNNWLRFKDTGAWAPVVVISQTQYDASSVALYTDTSASSLAFAAGSYDASAWWNTYGGAGVSDVTPLYDSSGNEVYCRRPWETVDKGYDIVVGWLKDIYMIGGELGRDGQEVYGFFERPTYYSGILARKVDPTGGCPGLPTLISGKLRSIYCKSGAGSAGYATPRYGLSGQRYTDITWFARSGYAYPAYYVNQVSTMNYARAKNSDTTSNYPSSEGMAFHKLSRIYAAYVKYGTFNLNSLWGHGISSNAGYGASLWDSGTQIRIRENSESSTYYYSAPGSGYGSSAGLGNGKGICLSYRSSSTATSGTTDLRWTVGTNGEAPKERCLESQMALSMAVECGVKPGTTFWWDGETYKYYNITAATELLSAGSEMMNAKLIKDLPEVTLQGFTSATLSSAAEAEYLMSGQLSIPVVEGEVWWGDVFDYGYGGLECVVDIQTPTSGKSVYTNPYTLYLCTHQKNLARETSITATSGGFGFERTYEKIGSGIRSGEAYTKSLWPYSIVPREKGGATLTTGSCAYSVNYDYNGWFSDAVGTHKRACMLGRGYAPWSFASARFWSGAASASLSRRDYSASVQIALA